MSGPLRIVVADDEPDMRKYFQKLLPRLGHQVLAAAATGRELVERCRDLQPDLVITDIKMPEMDGIEAAVQICRERPVPIILVSAYHDPALLERAEADHVLGYLVKPIKPTDLEPVIGLALRRFEQLQALRREADESFRAAASLYEALEEVKIIERAKQVLMTTEGIDDGEAMRRVQELAAAQGQPLSTAAETILATAEAGHRGSGSQT
jgi:response regulator NasT